MTEEDPRVVAVRAAVAALRPGDAREAGSRRHFLAAVDRLRRPFDEHADHEHVTASAIVTGPQGVLLHRHKRLGIWMQPGGHVDGDEAPWEAARREVREETGLDAAHPGDGPRLVHIDVHGAPGGTPGSAPPVMQRHVHLDLRYLLTSAGRPRPPAGESPDVCWFDWEQALQIADPGLVGALRSLRPQGRA